MNCRRRRVLKVVSTVIVCFSLMYMLLAQSGNQTQKVDTRTHADGQLIVHTNSREPNVRLRAEKDYDGAKRESEVKYLHDDVTFVGTGEKLIADYCNSPFVPVTGTEGRIPTGYKLRLVHVFIRHGDRTSIHRFPGYQPEAYNCDFSNWYSDSEEKIKRFAPTLDTMAGKQGVKSYFRNWSLYPNRSKCGTATLTSRGALQHIRLGQHLQKAYMDTNAFIDKHKPYVHQLVTKSTGFSRTYQSAVALLYGLLPDFNISQVEIGYSHNVHFCSEKTTYMKSCYCPHGNTLGIRQRKMREVAHSKSGQYNKLRSRLAAMFEHNSDQIPWFSATVDGFIPSFCHNHSPPCSDVNTKSCVNSTMLGNLWKEVLNADRPSSYDVTSVNVEYASIMLYPVMVEVAQRFRDLMEKRFTPKLVLYAGHDITITPLLVLLGLRDVAWPPFAARVVIETLESTSEHGKYFFRFIYNGLDRTGDVTFCRSNLKKGLCPLTAFTKFVFGELLQRYKYKSYMEACSE